MSFEDTWPLDDVNKRKLAGHALSALQQIKSPLGHKPYILFLKGQACRTIGDYRKAVNHLQQSAKLAPENIHAFLALGWCHKRCDEIELAIEVMETAVQIDGESAIAHYNLACYYALSGQVKQAVFQLANAIDLNPDFANHVDSESDFDSIRDDPEFVASFEIIV